jgi:hypothetical protein
MAAKRLALIAAFAALLGVGAPAFADDDDKPLAGGTFAASPHGQPLCNAPSDLKEYLIAAVKRDQQWLDQVDSCFMLKAGIKIVVLEDLPSDSDIMHIVKVRAFGTKKGSVTGYTLNVGLVEKSR